MGLFDYFLEALRIFFFLLNDIASVGTDLLFFLHLVFSKYPSALKKILIFSFPQFTLFFFSEISVRVILDLLGLSSLCLISPLLMCGKQNSKMAARILVTLDKCLEYFFPLKGG